LILGIIDLVMPLVKATSGTDDVLTVTSVAIYGGSIILLFLASTLYHSIPVQRAKRWLKTFDHCAIYLLIPGSYTLSSW
jgi:hemolysin III